MKVIDSRNHLKIFENQNTVSGFSCIKKNCNKFIVKFFEIFDELFDIKMNMIKEFKYICILTR